MNLALGALIIIIFLMPGAAFIKGYYSSIKRKQSYLQVTLNDLLVKGIIISLVLHLFALLFFHQINVHYKLSLLYNVIQGKEMKIDDEQMGHDILNFLLYAVSLNVVGFFCAKVIKWIVEVTNSDVNYYSLRTTNYWYQIFSGKYLEGDNVPGKMKKVAFIFVDIYTDNDILYNGILIDFNFSIQKNELENIVIRKARKRICHIHDDENNDKIHKMGEPTPVRGDILILPASKIKNINVTYFYVQDIPPPVKNIILPSVNTPVSSPTITG